MENYTLISTHDQQLSGLPESYQPGQLLLNSSLPNFIQLAPAVDDVTLTRTKDKVKESVCGVTLVESGITHDSNNSIPEVCPECGAPIHKVGTRFSYITHLPLGPRRIVLHVKKHRYHCKSCGFNITEDIPYQMDDHKVTTQMHTYICDLLSMGFNLTEVKYITKVGINIIKDIDKKRLEKLYTQCNENGERTLTPPTEYSQYLGIDEFLLHEGRHYATVIMDLMTGHVLYLQRTKKKDVVYQL